MAVDLAAELQPHVHLAMRPGWQTFARPGGFDPVGVMVHHTAGRNDLGVVINGRPDLPGPLANLYVGRDEPWTVTLISAGRCNHAGAGAQLVLDEVRRDVAPSGDAGARGLVDGPGGNGFFYGIEAENLGDGVQHWPVPQLEAIAQTCAALCRAHGWGASRVIGHREWTRRKPDPRGVSMPGLRARVDALIRSRPQEEDMALTTEERALLEEARQNAIDGKNYGVANQEAIEAVAKRLDGISTGGVDIDALAARVADELARRMAG